MVPNTNRFLKELFAELARISGRKKGQINFDDLGLSEMVDLLRNTNIEAVLEDFGRQTGGGKEDPVVHFYETFLHVYDKQQKIQRGVFYTPMPVVSFIVRSIHEILQKEFGLADGLADITTWGEMAEKHGSFPIPVGVKSEVPFVQILDPATGTGTFLEQVIEVVHATMVAKWRKQGKNAAQVLSAWNEYVPKNLLPRLHGFELMMAPYSVAHMKLGLKLRQTGYDFKSKQQLRVYLTNTLEPAEKGNRKLGFLPDFLSHESLQADLVKEAKPITVVLGNPPYSGISGNMNPWIDGLLKGRLPGGAKTQSYYEIDGHPLNEKKVWLQDDYVKFLRYGQWRISTVGLGILGFISNHSYCDNPTFRGMRQQLIQTFSRISIIDLHGSMKRKVQDEEDENVFDIEQGVAVSLFRSTGHRPLEEQLTDYVSMQGNRSTKYERLLHSKFSGLELAPLRPNSPYYFFVPRVETHRAEYEGGISLTELMTTHSTGVVTARDEIVIDFDKDALLKRIGAFRATELTDKQLRDEFFSSRSSTKYSAGDTRGWKLPEARARLRQDRRWRDRCVPYAYRPFDFRSIYYSPGMVDWPRPEIMRHMLPGKNIGLYTCRQIVSNTWTHVLPTRSLTDDCFISNKTRERGYLFPLYLTDGSDLGSADGNDGGIRSNFPSEFRNNIAARLNLTWMDVGRGDLDRTVGPEDLFDYIYALLNSKSYRARYYEFLKIEFPRIFFTSRRDLFAQLCQLGGTLVGLHLIDESYPSARWLHSPRRCPNPFDFAAIKCRASGSLVVASGYPTFDSGRIYINAETYFTGVRLDVWDHIIGGYQVCLKWLKDRRNRELTASEVEQYRRVLCSLTETLKVCDEIDSALSAAGGWPLAGCTA